MKIKIDFALNRRFGVVENAIFRLVLNGLTSTDQISGLLWIFSDEVIANAFRKLVNQQIVCADMDSRSLMLSEPVVAIIDTCINNSYEIEVPENLLGTMSDGHLLIDDAKTKESIINQLLPGIKLGFLAGSLDFVISVKEGESGE